MAEIPGPRPEAQPGKPKNPVGVVAIAGKNILRGILAGKIDVTKTPMYQNMVSRLRTFDKRLTAWEQAQNEKANEKQRRINQALRKKIEGF